MNYISLLNSLGVH